MTVPALYPYATKQLLTPEATKPPGQGGEPEIEGVQWIAHTHGFAGTSEAVGKHFNKPEVRVESHTSTKLNGTVIQYQLLTRQADAQGFANGWTVPGEPKMLGAWSGEHEQDSTHRFTIEQIHADGLLLAWLHLHGGLELEMLTKIDGRGIGYHKQFPRNNPNKHGCPFDEQVAQIPEIISTAKWFVAMSQPKAFDIVDDLTLPNGDKWGLQRDGGVVTLAGRHFWGSYPGLPAKDRRGSREFGEIKARPDGGYNLISTRNEVYGFPARTA